MQFVVAIYDRGTVEHLLTLLLLRWPVVGLLRRVVPWGLANHLHELAGSNGKGP